MSLTIKARDARLSILGYQPEVKSIYWSHLPTNLPTYGQNLDLTGSEITAVYVNGEEAVVTPYCTFLPADGAEVPNEPTMTVTATYTARSGKIVKADALLPIAIPSFLRIVVPLDVQPAKESGFYEEESNVQTNIYWKNWYGWQDVKTYLFWTRLDEVVRITEVEPTYSLESGAYYEVFSAAWSGFGLRHVINEVTYDSYHTPTSYHEVTCNAVKIIADYTIYGVDLQGETYLEVDYIDHLELYDEPKTCPTDVQTSFTLDLMNIKTVFLSNDYIIGWKRPHQFDYPWYDTRDIGSTGDTETITIGRQSSGYATLLQPTADASGVTSRKWKYDYACADGRVTWTAPDDE